MDVGLKTFAYLSTGEEIANPRFFRAEEAALARASRKLSKAPTGSKEREKKRKVVARVHERIGNRRKNFIEQEVCQLIKRFGLLAVEALVVRNMIRNPKLAKSIADASWSMFFRHLLDKAEEAGRVVVRVNPASTSQTCWACGHRQPMPLSVRVYECPHCGLVIQRDHNGSLNILEEGLKAVGRHSRVIRRAPRLAAVGSRHDKYYEIALDIPLKHPVYLQQWELQWQFLSYTAPCKGSMKRNLTEGDGVHG
jgi:putative transposase